MGTPRAGLQGSALVGLLSQLDLVDGPAAKPSFVEGMGRWLGWADAIPLAAALQLPGSETPSAAPAGPAATAAGTAAGRDVERVRAALTRAVAAGADAVTDDDFPPHRRRYTTLQQGMETAIGPLRSRLRAGLAPISPALGRLAAIDAVLDKVLAAREQALLSALPALLQKHFDRLRRAHAESTGAAGPGSPAPAPAGAWLPVFRHDMQRLLLAELDLRLQPALGLLDALRPPSQGTHE